MNILLTNDDGFDADGVRALYEALRRQHNVTVIAPEHEQSGVGHAFTLNAPLEYRKIPENSGIRGYIVAGTPSDCVKFGLGHLLPTKPDVVMAGLNVGENTGTSGFYSGTVAAAREGAFWQVRSFAFSICEESREFLSVYAKISLTLLTNILCICKNGFHNDKNSTFFNVNFPGCDPRKCRGVRVTKQSLAFFDDRYRRERTKGAESCYWLYGEKKDVELSDSFDSRALLNEYITITPLNYDATDHESIVCLEDLNRLEIH